MTVERNWELAKLLAFIQELIEGIDGNGAIERSSLRLFGAAEVIVALALVLDIPPVNAANVLAIFVLPPNEVIFSNECLDVKLASLGVLLKE